MAVSSDVEQKQTSGPSRPPEDANGDLPTDQSYTTDEDADRDFCTEHDHFDIPIIDNQFDINIDTLYEMIFTDSDMYHYFQKVKKTTKLNLSDWSETNADGEKTKTISYTIAVSAAIGPKTANTIEKQFMRSSCKPGMFYLIDTECYTSGIPYGDSFYLINRFCFNKVTSTSTRLKITSSIIYLKKVWSLAKNFIDKNVKTGTLDSYNLLSDLLWAEAKQNNRGGKMAESPTASPAKRRKNAAKLRRDDRSMSLPPITSSHGKSQSESTLYTPLQSNSTLTRAEVSKTIDSSKTKSSRTRKCKHKGHSSRSRDNTIYGVSVDTLVRLVLCLLLLLAGINAMLFYKLTSMEEMASKLITGQINRDTAHSVNAEDEWKPLLRDQQELHASELEHWRDVLSVSSVIMANMQRTMGDIQGSIPLGGGANAANTD